MELPAPVWDDAAAPVWRARWRVPDVVMLARTGSTNDTARRLAEAGAAAGAVVVAEEQTAGRGRFGRRWTAPPGRALLFSIVLRPRRCEGNALPSTAPIRVGIATAAAIEAITGVRTGLKWPNDIIAPDYGKVAGILCEGGSAGSGQWVVAGIGINTDQSADDFTPDLRAFATSIRLLTGSAPSRGALAGALIDALRPFRLHDLRPLEPAEIDEYARRDTLRGIEVLADGLPGTGDGIESDGALRLRSDDGVRTIRSGSVRPVTTTARRDSETVS